MRETPCAGNFVRSLPVDLLAFKINFAGSWLVNAGEQIKDRGLARAVWTNQSVNFALAHGHVQLADSHQAAETNRGFVGFQNSVAMRPRHRLQRSVVAVFELTPCLPFLSQASVSL